jgi:phage baseplate assembly protein W
MATYYGFNTIGQEKKFSLVDYDLVKRDVLNSLLIKQGEKPGNPNYGTSIWNIIFEPRIKLERQSVYPQENGVLIELEITVLPTAEEQRLTLFFDQNLNTVSAR